MGQCKSKKKTIHGGEVGVATTISTGEDCNKNLSQNVVVGHSKAVRNFIVPADKCGLIIGKGGKNVKEVQAETGVNVFIDNRAKLSDKTKKLCILRGPEDQMEIAMRFITRKIGQEMVEYE